MNPPAAARAAAALAHWVPSNLQPCASLGLFRSFTTMFGTIDTIGEHQRTRGEPRHTAYDGVGGGAGVTGLPLREELKGRAASIQDQLSDLHCRFSQTDAAKHHHEHEWHQQWQEQVRRVSACQAVLRKQGVAHGIADTLYHAEHVVEQLESSLSSL